MSDILGVNVGDRLYRKTLGGYSTYTVTEIGSGKNCITIKHDSSGAELQLTTMDLIKYDVITPEIAKDIWENKNERHSESYLQEV
jgi:hypothetical protein